MLNCDRNAMGLLVIVVTINRFCLPIDTHSWIYLSKSTKEHLRKLHDKSKKNSTASKRLQISFVSIFKTGLSSHAQTTSGTKKLWFSSNLCQIQLSHHHHHHDCHHHNSHHHDPKERKIRCRCCSAPDHHHHHHHHHNHD